MKEITGEESFDATRQELKKQRDLMHKKTE